MNTVQNNVVSPSLLATMNPAAAASKATDAGDTQDRFLKLLVTQMKNQDPLNPMDNAQVTSQMAQLSTVTGIEKLNTTLAGMMSGLQSNQAMQAANMIGHGVLVPGSRLALADGKALFGFDLAQAATDVKVTIRDAAGNAVQELSLGAQPAGVQPLLWDGQKADGSAAANGIYSFEVSAASGGQASAATALSFDQVSSVSTGAQGVTLNLPVAGSVSLADIRQIL